jgi:PPK2 family polyphosphate:nucleotide phosphotransferase
VSPTLVQPPQSRYLVPFDGSFRVADAPTVPPQDAPEKKHIHRELEQRLESLDGLQRKLAADGRYAVLLVLQGMDAAGKDGTIRAVMRGVDPAGCRVHAFKEPTGSEREHDFLWRVYRELPPRGNVGVFNRSHYEEVTAVRVHPEYLQSQNLPRPADVEQLWAERLESIIEFERHLARNGTVILKFWLNISRRAQRRRFLKRIDEPESNWKFSPRDVEEARHWDDYMRAYEQALAATSRPWAPWYAVPADHKPYMRWTVADLVVRTLSGLDLRFPGMDSADRARMAELREELQGQGE